MISQKLNELGYIAVATDFERRSFRAVSMIYHRFWELHLDDGITTLL